MTDDIPTTTMFFFGTLMDPDILAIILGRSPQKAECEAAFLRGRRRVHVAGRPYPMLVEHAGGRVEGVLVHGLGDRDRARLAYYEGWEYVTEPVTVRTLSGKTVATEMFTCSSGILPDTHDWRLDVWQRKHKPAAVTAATETMTRFARVSA
ncbi:gamma-glutamylcyclotransferase family protein [Magnetospirillum sp. SS-4]|uniref:gamma-glutamylcyclotransferase family protein n=1 Tax=Magnetospirillum sp. SS-4 TaxID=2681465 RepID=UPI00138278F3